MEERAHVGVPRTRDATRWNVNRVAGSCSAHILRRTWCAVVSDGGGLEPEAMLFFGIGRKESVRVMCRRVRAIRWTDRRAERRRWWWDGRCWEFWRKTGDRDVFVCCACGGRLGSGLGEGETRGSGIKGLDVRPLWGTGCKFKGWAKAVQSTMIFLPALFLSPDSLPSLAPSPILCPSPSECLPSATTTTDASTPHHRPTP